MLESLDAISGFYTDNTVDSRRALRHDLEAKNLQLARKFLGEFDLIKDRIEQVSTLSDSLQVRACVRVHVMFYICVRVCTCETCHMHCVMF